MPDNENMDAPANIPPLIPIILCGGGGSRLWPVSRQFYPKPFVKRKEKPTLFMETVLRAAELSQKEELIIVCNEAHRFYVQDTLKQCGVTGHILLEEEGRNTAPAITLGAMAALERYEDSLLLILPSDHAIANSQSFLNTVRQTIPAAMSGKIVLFGAPPDKAERGYGYIEKGEYIGFGCATVKRFVEKPTLENARAMLEKGGFYWNSGIFFARASALIEETQKYAENVWTACDSAWRNRSKDLFFTRPCSGDFLSSPSISIDYAILERSSRLAMAPLQTAWSDLGSWNSFYEIGAKDDNGNVTNGDVLLVDVNNSYVHSEKRLVAAMGVNDLAIIESSDAVLIMPREVSQDVRNIVDLLKEARREEYQSHPKVYRPWGSYESLVKGDRFQVKRIIVNPAAALSRQFHHHRSEHWVIVKGSAQVTIDDKEMFLTENQSVYIPVNSLHSLRNPGRIPLEMIEIQTGAYLGEDDIVRVEDLYGRS